MQITKAIGYDFRGTETEEGEYNKQDNNLKAKQQTIGNMT